MRGRDSTCADNRMTGACVVLGPARAIRSTGYECCLPSNKGEHPRSSIREIGEEGMADEGKRLTGVTVVSF